ncbi:sensor histidine kinase [Marinicella sp. W31]|uniref:sensor histidine kinase n=1 Tax=Marinicella sp. W31 TaxID=3023713 RepID=UPI0037568CBA
MALLKAPMGQKSFWILTLLGWGAFALANFIQRQSLKVESLEIGLVSVFSLLVVNTILCFVFRELIHRFGWLDARNTWIWFKVFFSSVVFGFMSAFLMILVLSSYLVLMGYMSRLIFPMANVYGNSTVTSLLMFLWAALYISINYVAQLRAAELQLKESQLNILSGQLNPHFLFNGLNNIRGLMLENVEKSRHMLTALADILRYALRSNKNTLQRLRDEIEIVRSYVDLASIQYEERLRYEEQIETELMEYYIPPMMIQLLVENALKHGIDRSPDGGALVVKVFNREDELHIQVCNPGQLNDEKSCDKNTGLGLKNIRQRLQLMFADNAGLSMHEKDGTVWVEVYMPLIAEAI